MNYLSAKFVRFLVFLLMGLCGIWLFTGIGGYQLFLISSWALLTILIPIFLIVFALHALKEKLYNYAVFCMCIGGLLFWLSVKLFNGKLPF